MNPLIQLKKAAPVFVVALVCFGFLPTMQAVIPPPDGGYPGFNTAEGQDALFSLTGGQFNTALGAQTLHNNTTGPFNTAVGVNALYSNNSSFNTAVGTNALVHNTTGGFNTATGVNALFTNTVGIQNTANGVNALLSNTDGIQNTAIGEAALLSNTFASANTGVGFQALANNVLGGNTAVGAGALQTAVNSPGNVAVGFNALLAHSGGIGFSVAVGYQALFHVTTGGENTAVGDNALATLVTGNFNTAVGDLAGANHTGGDSLNIDIGAGVRGVSGESSTTRIGNIYTTIQPEVGVDPDYVTINSTGRLGRANISSRRYKHEIKPMDKVSEKLYALKPVSFRYNKEYDATQTIAFGLIAEDVVEVYPELVGRNPKGQPESVRYEQINAMLLNEFLKEHGKVQELEATVARLKNELQATATRQQKQIEALTAGLQKVSDQLEASKPAPQMVNNP